MPWNWTDGDFASSRRMNMGSTQKMTGTEIAAVVSADVEPGVLIYCTETGSGFTANNLYQRNEDNTAYDIVGLKGHTHVDAETGGDIVEIEEANIARSLVFDKRWSRASDYWPLIVSSGTVTEDSTFGFVKLSSGTTSGGSATISGGGARTMWFQQPSTFECVMRVSSSTNFQVKVGVRAEDINGGNLTPRKYGIEGCSTSGTNWLIFSSDGTTRSTLSTSAPVATGQADIYRLEHTPGTSIDFYKNGTLVASKTTNVPSHRRDWSYGPIQSGNKEQCSREQRPAVLRRHHCRS